MLPERLGQQRNWDLGLRDTRREAYLALVGEEVVACDCGTSLSTVIALHGAPDAIFSEHRHHDHALLEADTLLPSVVFERQNTMGVHDRVALQVPNAIGIPVLRSEWLDHRGVGFLRLPGEISDVGEVRNDEQDRVEADGRNALADGDDVGSVHLYDEHQPDIRAEREDCGDVEHCLMLNLPFLVVGDGRDGHGDNAAQVEGGRTDHRARPERTSVELVHEDLDNRQKNLGRR
mmetsp:Transcript_32741/g.90338  ORF Transcript_32741/g.90338 Transcript_32741/m.90338 type:complete len:233 (+) Transcript_32741:1963-2661(+)